MTDSQITRIECYAIVLPDCYVSGGNSCWAQKLEPIMALNVPEEL
jgi:hypothetical protein